MAERRVIHLANEKSKRQEIDFQSEDFNFLDLAEEIICPCGCERNVLLDHEEFDREFYLEDGDGNV
jgi:hypothetical protein